MELSAGEGEALDLGVGAAEEADEFGAVAAGNSAGPIEGGVVAGVGAVAGEVEGRGDAVIAGGKVNHIAGMEFFTAF